MALTQTVRPQPIADQATPWYIIGGFVVVIMWAYWNTVAPFMDVWISPQYSHGFLVPIFAAVLLAMRREPWETVSSSVRWWGVGIIAGGLLLRLFGSYFQIHTLDNLSLIPVLMGVFVIAGGWPALRWSAAPLAFLLFMLPLPTEAERKLFIPLQSVATVLSNYVLQTMGADSYRIGNLIIIGDNINLNVEEACSGLRMGTIFLAMAVALTMIIDRPWWEKTLIIASAVPIAIMVNVIRIVITALLYMLLGPDSEFAKHFFHDLAGWFMMPIALGFMYVEMQILDHVFVEESRTAPTTSSFGPASTVRRPMPTQVR